MAIERVVSPFAASKRSIKRLERKERELKKTREFARRMAAERLALQKRKEGRRRWLEAEKALADERMEQFRTDLRNSILQNKPVGMFAAKKPRINKVIVHLGTEGRMTPEEKARREAAGITFDPVIEESHLRDMAARTNALNLLVTGEAQARKQAAANVAPDMFPQDMFRPIFETSDPAAEAAATGPSPGMMARNVLETGVGPGGIQPFTGEMPQDLDVTQLFQGPEYVGEETPAPRMQHLFKMMDMMQGRKMDATEAKVKAIREAGGSDVEVLRALGALEKPTTAKGGGLTPQIIQNMIDVPGVDEGTKQILRSLQTGTTGKGPVTPTRGRGGAREQELERERIRRDFIRDQGLEPTDIEFTNGDVIVTVGVYPNERRFVIAR